jgi:hypothetical protein
MLPISTPTGVLCSLPVEGGLLSAVGEDTALLTQQPRLETAKPQPDSSADGFWGSHLARGRPEVPWVWEGFLAAGNTTLLTSQWKSGKTTLVSILLSRLREGGTLAGLNLAAGKAVIVSEESPELWRPRHQKLDLSHIYFFCRPFTSRPTPDQWHSLLDKIEILNDRHHLSLLVLDTLATFLPTRNESNAGCLLDALLPLQRLAERGLAILLLHHPRKGEPLPGQAARGSGALAAFVDIILEKDWCCRAQPDDRRRNILAFSRHERTPAQTVIELNPDGTDYLVHGTFQDNEFTENWSRLRMVLEDAPGKRTRQQLLTEWPPDFPAPPDRTLWRWLARAVTLGLVLQEGTGRRNDPFRYWLPDQEAKWRSNPMYEIHQLIEESNRKTMGELRKSG